jgi:hypothetical protein
LFNVAARAGPPEIAVGQKEPMERRVNLDGGLEIECIEPTCRQTVGIDLDLFALAARAIRAVGRWESRRRVEVILRLSGEPSAAAGTALPQEMATRRVM